MSGWFAGVPLRRVFIFEVSLVMDTIVSTFAVLILVLAVRYSFVVVSLNFSACVARESVEKDILRR